LTDEEGSTQIESSEVFPGAFGEEFAAKIADVVAGCIIGHLPRKIEVRLSHLHSLRWRIDCQGRLFLSAYQPKYPI
jgi:hypothetical protein